MAPQVLGAQVHDPALHLPGLEQEDPLHRKIDQLPAQCLPGQLAAAGQAEDHFKAWLYV